MVIQCFFDDSGKESQRDHRHVVLAGYIGHDSLWHAFNAKWRHLLLRHGLTNLHMREWEGERNKRGWSVAAANEVLGEFVECVRSSQMIGFGIAVDADVWRELPKERVQQFGDAQQFCFSRILSKIMQRMQLAGENDVIDVVFDQDFEFSNKRLNVAKNLFRFDRLLSQQIGSMCFANSQYHYGLQAADFLAWVTRRKLADMIAGKPDTPRWNRLFADLPYAALDYEGEHWDRARIEEKLPEAEADLEKNIRIEAAQAALEKARAL